ncbi:MAG: ATP-binding protein [SAR324 cluster bacterium]|uniref:ATP-binding protein n=1 Tax=SAR324 cluster bacterium TaxID=2024889 RepID=A0A7X9IL07_9DELT|nr:ATP-binding protein [SAR324 cluster bacterium]
MNETDANAQMPIKETFNFFPIDSYIGILSQVSSSSAKLVLASKESQKSIKPSATATSGDFVLIKSEPYAIFGQISDVSLAVQKKKGNDGEARVTPVAVVDFLASVEIRTRAVSSGVLQTPKIGSSVYIADPKTVQMVIESRQKVEQDSGGLLLHFATLPNKSATPVGLTPERLFGRHCAVLGATGGGKSWTIASLVEEIEKHRAKLILFDATGEYYRLQGRIRHVHVGAEREQPDSSMAVAIPYFHLTEDDLFAIFKPDAAQAPKLRAAMKSLKVARLMPILATGGLITKADRSKVEFEKAYENYINEIENPYADFEILNLTRQIQNECVFHQRSAVEPLIWGGINSGDHSQCIPLINRIQDILNTSNLAPIFHPGQFPSLFEELHAFLKDRDCSVLRISLKHLSFYHNAREIVGNAIGRHLLELARREYFRQQPMVMILDEAHQFLNTALLDQNIKLDLDAFKLIAKEGRKYSLSLILSTQRPRDIPEDILSQMGTMLIHRLVNDRDRAIVERASAEIDRASANMVPSLTPGEAIIVGVDFPVPLAVKVKVPKNPPDSMGPDYQKFWAR